MQQGTEATGDVPDRSCALLHAHTTRKSRISIPTEFRVTRVKRDEMLIELQFLPREFAYLVALWEASAAQIEARQQAAQEIDVGAAQFSAGHESGALR